jgi:drug/metabolite transporter (DMT)-like permease
MKEKSLKNLLPLLLAVVVMMLWGSLYPTVKLGYEKFEIDTAYYPNLLMFAGMRFTVSGALITLFLGVKNKAIPTVKSKKEWGGIALVALFAVILNYGCAFYGLSLVESSKTALLKQSGVLIFIVLCALIFKDDKMTVGKGVGAVLGLGSIIILNINQLGLSMGLGEAIIIASSFCTVTASVICKKLLKNTDSIVMTGYSQLLGGVVLLVIGLACGGSMRLKEFGDYALFGYMTFATCASYMIWYTIIKICELSKLFIIKLSEPLFAAIIGAIILSENIFQWHYVGAFLCIATAVVVSNLHFKKKKKDTNEVPETENTEIVK